MKRDIQKVTGFHVNSFSAEIIDIRDGMDRVDGDESLYKSILQLFISDTPELIHRLQDALENNDVDKAKCIVHSLRSSSLCVGAKTLGELAASIERMLEWGDHANAYSVFHSVHTLFGQILEMVKVIGWIGED